MGPQLELFDEPPSLEKLAKDVCDRHPKQVEAYKGGKCLLGFFLGIIMKEQRGSVNPRLVSDALIKELDSR